MWQEIKGLAILISSIAVLIALFTGLFIFWPGARADELFSQDELVSALSTENLGVSQCGDYIQIRLINNSPYELFFSGAQPFRLEHFSLFAWREVPLRLGVGLTDDLCSIPGNSEVIVNVRQGIYRHSRVIGRRYRWRMDVSQNYPHQLHSLVVEG